MAAPDPFAEVSDSSCTAGAVHTWQILLQKSAIRRVRGRPRFLEAVAERPAQFGGGVDVVSMPRQRLRDTVSDHWRWSCQLLGEPTKVLGDGCQCELELGSARSAQSQPAKPQDAFEMGEQHLNTLSFVA